MFNYLFLKYIVFYFVFLICSCAVTHTADSKSENVSIRQNNYVIRSIKNDQTKGDGKKTESLDAANHNKTTDNSEEKIVSPSLINNLTVHNKPVLLEDQFNSTASLPSWMLNIKEGALQRTGYVALGFMSIVMIFFIVRAVR